MSLEKETRIRFQFSFPDPDLCLLLDLAALVEDHDGFRNRYGNLLSLMKVKVDSMYLRILSHFYDPTYHCFTSPIINCPRLSKNSLTLWEFQSVIRFLSLEERRYYSTALLENIYMFQRLKSEMVSPLKEEFLVFPSSTWWKELHIMPTWGVMMCLRQSWP